MALTNESVWLKHLSGYLMSLAMWKMSSTVWPLATSQVSTGRVDIVISPRSKHPEGFSLVCAEHDLLKVLLKNRIDVFLNPKNGTCMPMDHVDFILMGGRVKGGGF